MKQPTARLIIAFCLSVALVGAWAVKAEVVDSEKLLLPLDPRFDKDFGYSVAVSGGTAVVGAPGAAIQIGSAYVYTNIGTNWVQRQKLVPVQATTNNLVGASVAIDNDVLVIGAPGFAAGATNPPFGFIYFYQRTTNGLWVEQASLAAPDFQRADRFGVSVAVSGQTMVVGSSFHSDYGSTNSGAIYVYDITIFGLAVVAKFVPNDVTNNSFFGQKVAISGDTIVATAASSLTSAGAAYVFVRVVTNTFFTNWVFQQKFVPDKPVIGEQFGFSVAVEGDTALVGAPFSPSGGSVFAFERMGRIWRPQTQIVSSDLTNGDNFGFSVALQNARAVIGAEGKDSNNIAGLGAAYVFANTNAFTLTNLFSLTNGLASTNGLVSTNGLAQSNLFAQINVVPGSNVLADTNPLVPTNLFAQTNAFADTNIFAVTNAFTSTNALVDTNVFAATNVLAQTNGTAQTNAGWIEQQKLLPLQTANNFEFGFSVGIGSQGVIVGAPAASISNGTGAAYAFSGSQGIVSILSATATPAVLVPPNHLLVPVTISVTTTGSNVTSRIISVTSNQAVVGLGLNATSPDWIITGDLTLLLRAESNDNINLDRIYNILILSVDSSGNAATKTVQVIVPRTLTINRASQVSVFP